MRIQDAFSKTIYCFSDFPLCHRKSSYWQLILLRNTVVVIDTLTAVELILNKVSLVVLFISDESLCIADHSLTCFSKEQVIEAYSLVHTIIYCSLIEFTAIFAVWTKNKFK
jgi:hypothetical protein